MPYKIDSGHFFSDDYIEHITTYNTHESIITPKVLLFNVSDKTATQLAADYCNLETKTSAHLIVDDTITQLIPFNIKAWFTGPAHWRGYYDVNEVAIGVTLVKGQYSEGVVEGIALSLAGKYKLREAMFLDDVSFPADRNFSGDVTHKLRRVVSEVCTYGNASGDGNFICNTDAPLFDGPDASFKRVGLITRGTKIKVLHQDNKCHGWSLVQADIGRAYILSDYLLKA